VVASCFQTPLDIGNLTLSWRDKILRHAPLGFLSDAIQSIIKKKEKLGLEDYNNKEEIQILNTIKKNEVIDVICCAIIQHKNNDTEAESESLLVGLNETTSHLFSDSDSSSESDASGMMIEDIFLNNNDDDMSHTMKTIRTAFPKLKEVIVIRALDSCLVFSV